MRALGETDLLAPAFLARAVAPELCAPTGCAWYHGAWPTLRLLGLVAEPRRNAAFFTSALRRAVSAAVEREGHADVLVSGAADGGMLELVLEALASDVSRGDATSITVLDRCATPVRLSSEYASRVGVQVDEWVSDIFEVDGDRTFDAVITHGLFGLIPDGRRTELAARWAAVVRPGGSLITTSSLSGADAPTVSTFAPEAVDDFARQARDATEAGALPVDLCSPEAAEAMARTWAEHVEAYPVRSSDELRSWLEPAGFDVEITVRQVEGRLGTAKVGPWTARTGRYAEIVAVRR